MLLAEDAGYTAFSVDSVEFAVSGGEASFDCGDVLTIVVPGRAYGYGSS